MDRQTAAKACGMDRQTLRDWVHHYNAEGIAGLRERRTSGNKSPLGSSEKEALPALVEAGPDPAVHKVVRWRRVDLQKELKVRLGVEVHERTVGKYLADLGYRRLSVRPRHPESDPEAQEALKKTSPKPWPRHSRRKPVASPSKFGSRACPGEGRGRSADRPARHLGQRIWAKRGTRPRAPRGQRYNWAYLFGAACPGRAASAAIVVPEANAAMMNLHLEAIAKAVAAGAHAAVLLDGAGLPPQPPPPRARKHHPSLPGLALLCRGQNIRHHNYKPRLGNGQLIGPLVLDHPIATFVLTCSALGETLKSVY